MRLGHACRQVLLSLAVLAGLTGMGAAAFEVSPMRAEMQPVGARASTTFSVLNQTSAELPIEVSVERRTFHEDGASTTEPDPDSFIVFPEQFSLAPGASRAVRVQYVGDPALAEGVAYVLKFNQVPVDLSQSGGGLQVVYSFGAAVYVEPNGSRATPEVKSFSQNGAALDLSVFNAGNRHANLSRGTLRIDTDQGRVTLSGADLAARFPVPVLAPGQARQASLSLPEIETSKVTGVAFMPAEY